MRAVAFGLAFFLVGSKTGSTSGGVVCFTGDVGVLGSGVDLGVGFDEESHPTQHTNATMLANRIHLFIQIPWVEHIHARNMPSFLSSRAHFASWHHDINRLRCTKLHKPDKRETKRTTMPVIIRPPPLRRRHHGNTRRSNEKLRATRDKQTVFAHAPHLRADGWAQLLQAHPWVGPTL